MNYEIGKMYQVPCVENPPWKSAGRWLPVIGPLHEDAEIVKFDDHHYHIDWRFVSDRFFNEAGRSTRTNRVHAKVFTPSPGWGKTYSDVVVHRRKKCLREMPEFPIIAPWLRELEDAFEMVRLNEALICPHRGMPLAGCPIKNRLVVCPGHGLQWNVWTGEMVRR